MLCKNCGQEIQDASMCPYCGAIAPSTTRPQYGVDDQRQQAASSQAYGRPQQSSQAWASQQAPGQQSYQRSYPQPQREVTTQESEIKLTRDGLRYKISYSPTFALLTIYLNHGQSVTAEAGAMMFMTPTINIHTHGRGGGLLKSLGLTMFGGETFFVNTYTATAGPGEIGFVGSALGDVMPIELMGNGMILQSGSYVASTQGIATDLSWQGLKGFLAERDIIMLRVSGTGTIWSTSFGAIIARDLQQGEVLSVDTHHVVGFADTMPYQVRKVGGLKSFLFSGEGFVTDFYGPGRVYLQTRHIPAFARMLIPYLPRNR